MDVKIGIWGVCKRGCDPEGLCVLDGITAEDGVW